MNSPFDYQILKLTDAFYNTYSKEEYPELLLKSGRSYNCLLIESHYGYFICVPFRTNIRHKNAFLFTNTKRSKKYASGLDYSKIIYSLAIIEKSQKEEESKKFIDYLFSDESMNIFKEYGFDINI